MDQTTLYAEQRPHALQKGMLFPLLPSFYATRVVLSYLTPFELQIIVRCLNKWSYSYIHMNRNLSLVYGRTDPSISVLYRPSEDQGLLLKRLSLNTHEITLTEIVGFPTNLAQFKSIETINNTLYIIGGFDRTQDRILSFCFKLAHGKLTEQTAMCTPRISFSLLITGSYLLVAGGFYNGTLGVCEKLSLTNNTWHNSPPLNIGRCNSILCKFNADTLYAFGGTDGHTPLNSIEKYTEATGEWRLLPPLYQMNYAVIRNGGFAQQISAQKIIIFGGKGTVYKQPIQQCFIYNAGKEEFVGSTTMEAEKFDNVGVHLEHERLYLLGACAQFYDCKNKKWSMIF